jgi:hypothetical protein
MGTSRRYYHPLTDSKAGSRADRELDLVEMAVYGDVIRPGLQCRIRSFSEHAGLTSKRKENVPACELPHSIRKDATLPP